MGEPRTIRSSTSLRCLALAAVSCLACAKGTEISATEIVILSALPPEGADAGADAAAPAEAEPTEAAPSSADAGP